MNAPTLRYALRPEVRTSPFDVAGERPSFLVETSEDRRFQVSAGVHQVIETLRPAGEVTVDELTDLLSQAGHDGASREKVDWLLQSVLLPRGIAVPSGQAGDGASGDDSSDLDGSASVPMVPSAAKRSSYLWVRIPLIGPRALAPITAVLKHLIKPRLLVVLSALAIAAHIFFYSTAFAGSEWSVSSLGASQLAMLLLALNFTTMFHELGHASASRHYGVEHGKIGWGIYLWMFVLYADVSAVWRLPRKQRAMVDAAGMYFELLAAGLLIVVYLRTGAELLLYLVPLINLSILLSLNPVLRRDGYWLLSDLAGQENLRDASTEALSRLFGRGGEAHLLRDKPNWLQWVIIGYSFVAVAFSVAMTWWIGKRVVQGVLPDLASAWATGQQLVAETAVDWWALAALVGRTAISSVFLLIVAMSAWALVGAMIGLVRPQKRSAERTQIRWREAS